MAAPDFDIALDHTKVKEEVFQLLELLKPDWKKEDVKIKVLEDGHVNVMIACYVTNLQEGIVVRVFGDMMIFPVHRKPGRETKTVRVMNELGLCVPILCSFKNGYCMEFVHGESVNLALFKKTGHDDIIRAALKELARYHSNENADLAKQKGIDDTPVITEYCDFALSLAPDFNDPSLKERFATRLPEDMKTELETVQKKLLRLMREANMPIAFCHNDTNPSNLFFNRDSQTATFLDYESCGFNYVAYDVAYFLVTLMAGARVDVKKHFPSKEFAVGYLRFYLECRQKLGDFDAVTDEMVETWYKFYHLGALAVNFWMGLVIMLFTKKPADEFAKDKDKVAKWFELNDLPIPETREAILKQTMDMVLDMFVNRFLFVKEELDKM